MKKIKHSIQEVRENFEKEGYTLLSTEYKNNFTPIKFICHKGHTGSILYKNWIKGMRCHNCTIESLRLSEDFVRNELEKEGFKLLSKYINSSKKIEFECPNGHRHNIPFRDWQRGQRCGKCSKVTKYDYEFVKEQFDKEDYKLLSDKYINNKSKLEFECPNGHKHKIAFADWMKGQRCGMCSKKTRYGYSFVKNEIEKDGYKLLSETYSNNKTYIEVQCIKGHKYKVIFDNWVGGSRCKRCSCNGTSKGEQEMNAFVNQYVPTIQNDRTIIKPYELDIVIPSLHIAIEFCGDYWHSTEAGKSPYYHFNKWKSCYDKGWKLLTIFEYEWNEKRELVEDFILKNIGVFKQVLSAKNCEIREITKSVKDLFLNENYLLGTDKSALSFGAYYEDSLLSVMTVGEDSTANNIVNKHGYIIDGKCKKAILDIRLSNIYSYRKIGFKISKYIKPVELRPLLYNCGSVLLNYL